MPSSPEVSVETLVFGVTIRHTPLSQAHGTELNIRRGQWGGDPDFCRQLAYQTLTRTKSGGSLAIPGTLIFLRQQPDRNNLIIAQRHPRYPDSNSGTVEPVDIGYLMVWASRELHILTSPGFFNINYLLGPTEVRGVSFRGFPEALSGLDTGKTVAQLEEANLGLNPEQLRQLLTCFLKHLTKEEAVATMTK